MMGSKKENPEEVYSPKALKLLREVKEAGEVSGLEEAQRLFKEGMLTLGWEERVNNLYRIKNKYGKIVRFKLNGEQERYTRDRSGHDLVLKSRQIGFTTFFCIYYYDKAKWENWDTGIMSHKKEHVQQIFEKVILADEWFERDWGQLFPQEKDKSNTTRLAWKDTKATMTVAFDFQGLTVRGLHVSEAAFIPGDRLTNSMQAVPDDGEISLESTPNGRGGLFYEWWQDWKKDGKRAPYSGHFYPWFEHYPESISRWDRSIDLSQDEEDLKDKFSLGNHHFNWMRFITKQKCGNSVETFNIQYPTDDISCFLSGESNVFPRKTLAFQEQFAEMPLHQGLLKKRDRSVEYYKEKDGPLKIWELPAQSGVYAIGCDPSGGSGKDAGCAQVINYHNGKQVAELYGFFDPDMMGEQLYLLGQFYNQSFICVESNNHGTAVLMKLRSLNYSNLYKRQSFNSTTKSMGTEWGFNTTANSKMTITDNVKAALRDGTIKIKSVDLMNELSTFVNIMRKGSDGRVVNTMKREAIAGCHDDRVMSLCMAYEMYRSRPLENRYDRSDDTMSDMGYSINHETGFYEQESGYY